jgi:hypothetical protein
MCKDAVNRDSTCQSIFRRLCTVKKIEDFKFPVSRPNDVSSRPNVHLSTVPSVRTTCPSHPNARQTSIIRPDDVSFHPDLPLCREASVPACIRPDLSAARPDVHLSTVPSVRTTCSSRPDTRQTRIISPDDVSFRPDPPLCREASVPTCIHLDLSAARPNVHQ